MKMTKRMDTCMHESAQILFTGELYMLEIILYQVNEVYTNEESNINNIAVSFTNEKRKKKYYCRFELNKKCVWMWCLIDCSHEHWKLTYSK